MNEVANYIEKLRQLMPELEQRYKVKSLGG